MWLGMNKNKLVGIHQPNFFPWIGYFNKISRSDFFVILDDVQFPKGGAGAWVNRNSILQNGKERWATVPISRKFSGTKNINEIKFAQDINWRKSYLNLIRNSYITAKYFSDAYEFLEDSINWDTEYLSELNIHLIKSVLQELDIIVPTFIKSSSLNKSGKSNVLLCSLIKSVGGDTYLCGGGADSYMDESIFKANNIDIIYQDYMPVAYPQINSLKFYPGLSIIDALMNCGFTKTKALVLGERNV